MIYAGLLIAITLSGIIDYIRLSERLLSWMVFSLLYLNLLVANNTFKRLHSLATAAFKLQSVTTTKVKLEHGYI